MKNGWFRVKLASIEPGVLHYQNNLVTRVWITEDEISLTNGYITDSFTKSKSSKSSWNDYVITALEFNKLKTYLEKLIGITSIEKVEN